MRKRASHHNLGPLLQLVNLGADGLSAVEAHHPHPLFKGAQIPPLGMFSATISREVLDISWVYQREPVEITVQADQENRPDIALLMGCPP